MIVEVMRVRIQIPAIIVLLQKRVDAGCGVIATKVEDVVRMVAVADVGPHLARQRFAGDLRVEVRHLGGVGVQRLRLTNDLGHQANDRIQRCGNGGHPVAHGRARQLDAVPAEDAFEAVQRQMIGVFAGGDLRQQARPGQALRDDADRHVGDTDMIVTLGAGILETHVLPHEQTGRYIVELLTDLLTELRTN